MGLGALGGVDGGQRYVVYVDENVDDPLMNGGLPHWNPLSPYYPHTPD
jgi:hypothetical protein